MTIVALAGREGMICGAAGGTHVTCTVDDAPLGGRVGGADVEVSGSGQVRASVSSGADDLQPADNTVLTST